MMMKKFAEVKKGENFMNKNNKITVIDSICGSGKTSWAIQEMNNNVDQKYIYITPFLDEIDRIKEECYNRYFCSPNPNKNGKKIDDFYNLLKKGDNIASTHSLFMNLNSKIIEELETQNYTLILDEAVNILEDMKINKKDIKILLDSKKIEIDDSTKKIKWIDDDYIGEDLKFSKLRNNCLNGDVYFINNSVMLWTFPVNIFKSFKEIYIMTYLFEGQIQKYYYDMYNIKYEYKSVELTNKVGLGEYERREYKLVDYKEVDKSKYKSLINIYEGKLNLVGERSTDLSSSWYRKNYKNNMERIKSLKNNTYNYFHNMCKSKSSENMWTVYKDYKSKLKGEGYSRGFVSCNARAVNEFKNKKNLAYLCNIYVNPMHKKLFELKDIKVNEDFYALDKIIQWMFRSQLRDDKPINIYIPSKRMRDLLHKWLNS